MKKIAIILAGGCGKRIGLNFPKQLLTIGDKTILEETLSVFQNHNLIDEIIVVINKDYKDKFEKILNNKIFSKITKILNGGKERFDSSLIALNAITDKNCFVLIHDAVRPFVSSDIITECIQKLEGGIYKAIDVVVNSTDTIVFSENNEYITNIPNRNHCFQGQTPQCFEINTIKKAYELAISDNEKNFTDDCSLVLKYKLSKVGIVKGDYKNIKITNIIDINIANTILRYDINKEINNIESNLNVFKNKNIIIFGGNTGIGKEICNILKKYTKNIFIASESNSYDITNLENIRKAFEDAKKEFNNKKIDFIVNTIGLLKVSKISLKSDEDILQEIMINYTSNIFIVKYGLEYINNDGSILLFSSSSAYKGRKNYSIYSSTKSAIINFIESISDELLESSNIKINVVIPSRTNTEMRRKNFNDDLNTLLDPVYVAEQSVYLLASNKTGYSLFINKYNKI